MVEKEVKMQRKWTQYGISEVVIEEEEEDEGGGGRGLEC